MRRQTLTSGKYNGSGQILCQTKIRCDERLSADVDDSNRCFLRNPRKAHIVKGLEEWVAKLTRRYIRS